MKSNLCLHCGANEVTREVVDAGQLVRRTMALEGMLDTHLGLTYQLAG